MSRVYYGQSGYCDCSMSENAVLAYADGEKPKSKWTKAAMVAALNEWLADTGRVLNAPEEPFEKWTKDELFTRLLYNSSWHHTGKYANETKFYAIDDDEISRISHDARFPEWVEEREGDEDNFVKRYYYLDGTSTGWRVEVTTPAGKRLPVSTITDGTNTIRERVRWCEIITPDGTYRIDEEEWPVAVMVARERGII